MSKTTNRSGHGIDGGSGSRTNSNDLEAFLQKDESTSPKTVVATTDLDKDDTTPSKTHTANGSTSSPATAGDSAQQRNFKIMLLIAMVVQNSMLALVGRYTRSGVPKDELFAVNHLVFTIEVGKLILSCAMEYYATAGNLLQSFYIHVFNKPKDTLNSLVPALLYLLQNSLLYVALGNLTAPLFQVTYQGKLVTTAIVSVILLNRTYSIQQWICLVILSFGVAVVVLGEESEKKSSNNDTSPDQNLVLGLTCVTISCFSSAFAGVYFEKVLKTESKVGQVQQASVWMRNIQLSFFSVVIAALQGWTQSNGSYEPSKPYFHGFTFWVWFLVLLQSAGGLLVAAVMKYADNVLKGLATGVSVVLATTVSIFLFGTPITLQFTFGAILILGSAYFFSNPLPVAILQKIRGSSHKVDDNNNIETKPFLPK